MCNSSSMRAENLSEARTIHGACPHDCPDTCALRVQVEHGRVVRVSGDPDHPPTHGALCTKVSRYPERTYHPERVLTPLRRVGAKGGKAFACRGRPCRSRPLACRLCRMAIPVSCRHLRSHERPCRPAAMAEAGVLSPVLARLAAAARRFDAPGAVSCLAGRQGTSLPPRPPSRLHSDHGRR